VYLGEDDIARIEHYWDCASWHDEREYDELMHRGVPSRRALPKGDRPVTTESMRKRHITELVPEGVVVAVVYLCAQGLMFLNKGIFWDDWVWYRQPWAVLTDMSRQLGSLWPGWTLAAPYQSELSIWVARIIAAACYLLASLWFLGILRRLGVDRRTRLVMALFFAVFPVNGARIPIATAAYGVSLALFVGGTRLVVASMERSSPWLRAAAAIALLLSLRTSSFGVLFPVVWGYVIWFEGLLRSPRKWPALALRHAELLLVPLAYVVLRAFVLIPSGVYDEYNTINFAKVIVGIEKVPQALQLSLGAPSMLGIGRMAGAGALAAALVVFALVFFSRGHDDAGMSRREAAWATAAGLAAVVVALLPYLFVGKLPALDDFSSRHQLLVPFGAALTLGGGLRFFFGQTRNATIAMLAVASLLIGGFVVADITNNVSYLRERYKDIAMMEEMRIQPEFRSATTFTFVDRASDLNANRRTLVRAYEYAGMMAETFGDQTRFGAGESEYSRTGMARYRMQFTTMYKMGAYVQRPVQYHVDVVSGPLGLERSSTVLRLLAVDLFKPAELRAATKGAILLQSHPAGSNN